MTQLLAFGLRVPPLRRLLARFRWPRPEHLARMNDAQFHGYVRAIGIEADALEALAEYRGGRDRGETVSHVRAPEVSVDRRGSAPVP